MDTVPAFNGNSDASKWLQSFEEKFRKKSKSQKLKRLENLLEGECRQWWNELGYETSGYDSAREAFVTRWAGGNAVATGCTANATTIPVYSVSTNTAPPPVPEREPSETHPIFSVLVHTSIVDPRHIYDMAFTEFSRAKDQEEMFRVIWDAAFEAGKQCGICQGRGEVRAESIEEGRQLGIALAEEVAKKEMELRESRMASTAVDTSDLPQPDQTMTFAVPGSPPTLDWADDADTIPTAVLIPPPTPPARDLSSLRSHEARPFDSLKRRAVRFRRSRDAYHASAHLQQFLTRRHPSGIGPGKPAHVFHWHPHQSLANCSSLPPLDWDRDPRLAQLGKILGDLGWVRR
ncbi:hypothetical protein VNI00_014113 [Paramarasmius palmivorus]|uniref:Uncharacterized protein n=1 Tax=Paramarasmius palmivorus TaxID=297713 RepID=A0AAW0BVQ2_9AGAR